MKKKAQFGMVDMVSVIVFVIVVVVFMIMMNLPGCSGKSVSHSITGKTDNVMQAEGKIDLLAYLRSPVEIDVEIAKGIKETKTISIAEAISIRAKDDVYLALLPLLMQYSSKSGAAQTITIHYPDPTGTDHVNQVEGFSSLLSTAYVPSGRDVIKVELYGVRAVISERVTQTAVPGIKFSSGEKTYVYWGYSPGSELKNFYGAWALEGWPCEADVKGIDVVCSNGYRPTMEKDSACFVDGIQFAKFGIRPPKEGCQKKDKNGNAVEEYKP